MKKPYLWTVVLVLPLFLATGAWALSVNDEQGVSGAYYGGIYHNSDTGVTDSGYAFDTIPSASAVFPVTSLTATNIAGNEIMVQLTGPYFGTTGDPYNNPSSGSAGRPGDLYISSAGWFVDTNPNNHGIGDKFTIATEHWNYVVPFIGTQTGVNDGVVFTYTSPSIFSLTTGYTPTSDQAGAFHEWRSDQAWRGGYGAGDAAGAVYAILNLDTAARTSLGFTVPAASLTFIFPDHGRNADALGYHWAMGCGNDVVEGGGTPVPEPGILFLFGLGIAGLAIYRRRAPLSAVW